jgi:hypothetical protein
VDARTGTPGPEPDRGTRVVVVLGPHVDGAAVAACCERIRSALRRTPGVVVDCDVERLSGPAVAVIEALARLRLAALGCGGELRLVRADPHLLDLLELLGFADVLPASEPPPAGGPDLVRGDG